VLAMLACGRSIADNMASRKRLQYGFWVVVLLKPRYRGT
jgi:hypothetical protein